MRDFCNKPQSDFGPGPYVTNVPRVSMENTYFRTSLWTGCNAQMTLMCIPAGEDIGIEIHEDTDQIIRVERGFALVRIGECKHSVNYEKKLCSGDTIFVPAGVWHNIINIGNLPLKLSSIYAPPHHPWGTIHHTKDDAQYHG